eukprot:2445395-Pleurochrysis_carterae.AAC.1
MAGCRRMEFVHDYLSTDQALAVFIICNHKQMCSNVTALRPAKCDVTMFNTLQPWARSHESIGAPTRSSKTRTDGQGKRQKSACPKPYNN